MDRERDLVRTISAVIPTLNEAAELQATVERLRSNREVIEIIVADGGSSDETVALATKLGCDVVSTARGRGTQMRSGAARARGDVVLLLHADTWVEPRAGQTIVEALNRTGAVGGGCWKRFREPHWLMRGSRLRCFFRYLLFRRFMGDQAIFVRRDILETIGGVPDMPIMEELELCKRLRKSGKLVLAPATVSTSARRFREQGVLRTYARIARVMFLYYSGTPPEMLKRMYERQ